VALRIAVAGVGFGTVVHVPAFLSEGLEVIGIMARRKERAEAAASAFGIEHAVTDYEALLALPGLDAVSIATPTAYHHDMALAALQAGKHVICEKPFALNVAQAKAMADAAQASDKTAMVAHEFRYASGRMFVKQLLDAGYVGNPKIALLRLVRGPVEALPTEMLEYREERDAASSGSGFLFGLGSHYIDALRHWFGEVVEVSGNVMTTSPERRGSEGVVLADADDTFSFTLSFECGVIAQMVGTRAAAFMDESTISIHGSAGSIVTPQRGFNPPAHGVVLGAQLGSAHALEALPVPAALEPFSDDRDDRLMPFRLFTREFLQGVEEGSSPAPNFVDGLRCQEVLDAVRASAATGQRVRLKAS
jgi:predicted dehydrogenase